MGETILSILQHSVGVDQYGHGAKYRNHFCTGPGSTDYPICREAVQLGLMKERPGNELTGGDALFTVTPEGLDFIEKHSPRPPKVSRSRERYLRWLNDNRGETFGEHLRFGMYKR